MNTLNEASLIKNIKVNSHALGIPAGAAEIFAKRAVKDAKKTLTKRKIITQQDLNRAVTKELKKYNPDLAYVYKNYDKII